MENQFKKILRNSGTTSSTLDIAEIDDTARVLEDIGDTDEIEEEAVEEKAESIETPEFGILSKVDVALIAERLQFNRTLFDPLLQQRGVRLIEEDVIYELMGLVQGQEVGLKEQYYQGLISEEEFDQLMSDYRARAFEKAREMLKDPDFGENVDRIGDQNPNVWGLFVNLSEINEVIEKSGQEEGIAIIGKDPESLGAILSQLQSEDTTVAITDNHEPITEDKPVNAAPPPEVTTVFEAPVPVEGTEPVEPKLSALERRDPEIRAIINQHLDRILEIPELNGPVSPPLVTRSFESIKKPFIDHALEEGWISAIIDKNHRDRLEYDPAAIATLLYLHRKEDKLPSRLKRKVQEIAQEEYRKRLKEKENNK